MDAEDVDSSLSPRASAALAALQSLALGHENADDQPHPAGELDLEQLLADARADAEVAASAARRAAETLTGSYMNSWEQDGERVVEHTAPDEIDLRDRAEVADLDRPLTLSTPDNAWPFAEWLDGLPADDIDLTVFETAAAVVGAAPPQESASAPPEIAAPTGPITPPSALIIPWPETSDDEEPPNGDLPLAEDLEIREDPQSGMDRATEEDPTPDLHPIAPDVSPWDREDVWAAMAEPAPAEHRPSVWGPESIYDHLPPPPDGSHHPEIGVTPAASPLPPPPPDGSQPDPDVTPDDPPPQSRAEGPVNVVLDADSFAQSFAQAIAPVLQERGRVLVTSTTTGIDEKPKRSFWANSWHPDVLLSAIAMIIVLVILIAFFT